MTEIVPSHPRHHLTLRELVKLVEAHGGGMDSQLTIESDGEPVYIEAYTEDGKPLTGTPKSQVDPQPDLQYDVQVQQHNINVARGWGRW